MYALYFPNLSIPGAHRLRVTPDQVAHRGLGVGNPLEAEIFPGPVLTLPLLDGAPHHPGVGLHSDRQISPGPEDLETEEEKGETPHAP